MRSLVTSIRRGYAWLLAAIGGAVARSMFKDAQGIGKGKRIQGIELVGRTPEELHLLMQALSLLSDAQLGAARRVHSWLRRITVYNEGARRNNFCEGTLFIRNDGNLPADRLAAYFYRVAVENMLFTKWGLKEVAISDSRCLLMVYRRELKLMKALNCSAGYINEEHIFIERCLAKISQRNVQEGEKLRRRFHLGN
jgi:hypothetical protein